MQFSTFFGIKQISELVTKKYNQDLLDIRQWWNDHDCGVRSWTRSIFGGVTDGSSAASGIVGEYISSVVQSVNATTTGQYMDFTTISLTAGDWDVTFSALGLGVATAGTWEIGISTGSAGNNFSDRSPGDNMASVISVSQNSDYLCVPSYRISISSTTTVRAKSLWTYSAGTPMVDGRLSARRVR